MKRPAWPSRAERALPPARIARWGERARALLRRVERNTVPAPVAMLELITAGWLAQALHAAAELGIAEALHPGPKSLAQLARELGVDEAALRRLVRALAQYGVFTLVPPDSVAQSSLSDTLREGAPDSVRGFVLYVGSTEHRAHWSELAESVRSGQVAIPRLRGPSFFDYLRENEPFGALFQRAMSAVSGLAQRAVLASYDFSRFRTLVDVGGGRGTLLAAILAREPALRGVLFDLPQVVRDAPAELAARGVGARCAIEAGSFFERVPSGADAHLLKHILHDWDDASALAILARVRAAMSDDGTLLLVEAVLPEDGRYHLAKLLDLEMLLSVGGRERTEAEFRALLTEAGFELARVVETAGPLSILEARPALTTSS